MEICKNCKYWEKKDKQRGECQNLYTQEEIHMITDNYFRDDLYYTYKKSRCCNFDRKPFFSLNKHLIKSQIS